MRLKREELYDLISMLCPSEYVIGMHGIDRSRMHKLNGIDLKKGIESILKNGLKVFSCRTINGTVKFFGRIDIKEDEEKVREGLTNYWYIGNDLIIVAIPTIIEDENGRRLFLGSTNLESRYKRYMGSTGSETTTLLDDVIMKNKNIIDSKYILGRCRILDNEEIEFFINPNHISFSGGKFSSLEYDEIRQNVMIDLFEYGIQPSILEELDNIDENLIKEIIAKLEEKIYSNRGLLDHYCEEAFICETLQQLIREKNLIKRKGIVNNSIREKLKEEANNENTIDSTSIIIEVDKGEYYGNQDCYVVKFYYSNKAQAEFIFNAFNNYLIPNFGAFSDRFKKNMEYIMPYLVDDNGEKILFSRIVGGTNVPEDILSVFIKIMIEKYKCTVKCKNFIMKDNFSTEIFESMYATLNKKEKNIVI